jgi:hypothetical protein
MTFAIGTSVETLVELAEMTVPVPEPTPYYSQYSESVETLDGGQFGLAAPFLVWRLSLLEYAEQRDQLKAYCTGASAEVVIQSPLVIGGADHYYACKMVWPVPEPENNQGLGISLDLEFRKLVELEVEP